MRYYDIAITEQDGTLTKLGGNDAHFTSFQNGALGGVTIPGALNIEMDIPIHSAEVPAGDAYVKIWGVDLNTINNALNLNKKNITIMAGMKRGLPLANLQVDASPIRNGIIFNGSVLQAFGNWQGGEQTLDLIIMSRLTVAPKTFVCKKGDLLSNSISKAFSDMVIRADVQIDSRLVAAEEPIIFIIDSIENMAEQLYQTSKNIIKDKNYFGIRIIKTDSGYFVTDNTKPPPATIQLDFTDFIGQPTWLTFNTLQIKCVLRSDIRVGNTITMPESNFTQGKFFNPKDGIAMTGNAYVDKVRHIANLRQPDANSWVTVMDVIPELTRTQ